ncbi:TPA: hypothetical protein ACP32N_005127 [Pseudomonas aeruginosa]
MGFVASLCAGAAAVTIHGRSEPASIAPVTNSSVETPQVDDVAARARIQQRYLFAPGEFDLDAAAKELAGVTIEGEYHICTQTSEITAEQYIEISRMLDRPRPHAKEFKAIVDHALAAPVGVADCSYRVLALIDRAAK